MLISRQQDEHAELVAAARSMFALLARCEHGTRPLSVTTHMDAALKTLGYTYDPVGNRPQLIDVHL